MQPLLLAAVAGVSLSATAVTWWNGRRTDKVMREIEGLEEQFQRVHAADAAARRKLINAYLEHLNKFLDQEHTIRNEIATELITSLTKARDIKQKRFGAVEGGSFQRLVLELELALSRVNAERSYLNTKRRVVANAIDREETELPSPSALQLPNDYPREGGFVNFEQKSLPSSLHDYCLRFDDWSDELGGRAVLYDVDHSRRTARVSTARCFLLDANLTDGGGALRARVDYRDVDGVHLDYLGVPLLLPSKGGRDAAWLTPESITDVYPDVWTLSDTLKASKEAPLPVRLHPRVDCSRTYWLPIPLSYDERDFPDLDHAIEHISSQSAQEDPWRIHLLDSGGVAFSLRKVTLLTRPDFQQRAFVVDAVQWDSAKPDISVRLRAGLRAFVPGTPEDEAADRSLFGAFVEAVHAELGSQKQQLLQRRSAFRLRKLSLIYQDQEEHLRSTSSCGFIVGKADQGGRVIDGTIIEPNPPAWLSQALSSSDVSRMRAVGSSVDWGVRRAEWLDRRLGTCRIQLSVPDEASFNDISPFCLRRLELAGEGSQQQTLSRALEAAILGRFVSSSVHATLLGLSGDAVANVALGRAAVEKLLGSTSDVTAIWGPPGTGKTTTLVKWLLSLFPIGRERDWPTVLLSAPTHVAVTKLLKDLLMADGRLSDEAVRYGSEEKIKGSDLEPIWHRSLLQAIQTQNNGQPVDDPGIKRWAEVLSTPDGREAAAKWLLGSRHLHAATCVGIARRDYGLRDRTFDIAVVDEAGKAFGAELLLPAAVARRLVLVGDHNQLPPTVTTDVFDDAIGYRLSLDEVEELLQRNMFHEIFEQLPEDKKGMLTKQYRMHEQIGSLVSDLFYDGKLSSDRSGGDWSLTRRRVVFVDFTEVQSYRNRRSRKSQSQENPTERAALHTILKRLSKKNERDVSRVLVICPYKAQRVAVEEETRTEMYSFQLEATTVDAVQGGEADMIILLMTRSCGRVQFLLDRHRLNVALSRARDAVIVLGHVGCLTPDGDGPIGQLLKLGQANGSLELIQLAANANFSRDLAPRIIP